MHDALQTVGSPRATADALTKLVPKVRDLITNVAFGSCYSYYELRNATSACAASGLCLWETRQVSGNEAQSRITCRELPSVAILNILGKGRNLCLGLQDADIEHGGS